jgi:hypothetical protein
MKNDLKDEELYLLGENYKFNIFERIHLSISILIISIFFSISNIIFKNFFFYAITEFYRQLEKFPFLKNELKQIHDKVSEKESRKTMKYSKLIEELGIQRK